MKFRIRFKIINRFGRASTYTLKEFCLSIIDRYSLSEREICTIITLRVGEEVNLPDFTIQRIK